MRRSDNVGVYVIEIDDDPNYVYVGCTAHPFGRRLQQLRRERDGQHGDEAAYAEQEGASVDRLVDH